MPVLDNADREPPVEGAIEFGIWCNACFLPSGMRWPLHTVADGVKTDHGTAIVCVDCGAHLDEEGNPR